MSNEDGVYYTQDLISKVIALFAQIEIAEKEFNQKKADVLIYRLARLDKASFLGPGVLLCKVCVLLISKDTLF